MIDWKRIHSHDQIPSGRDTIGRLQYFLAMHHSTRYTSDIFYIWKDPDGTICRWPHKQERNRVPGDPLPDFINDSTIGITHIAEINLPADKADWDFVKNDGTMK